MTDTSDSRRILDLLAQGKITVEDADQLLRAINAAPSVPPPGPDGDSGPRPATAKWLRITVDKQPKEGRPRRQVSIRVPMSLVRGGVKLGAMFPHMAREPLGKHLRDQGIDIDLSKIDLAQLDSVINSLGETTIDVDDGKAQVRISCE
jgi:hypothetical protein